MEGATMVSDQDIANGVETILRQAPATSISSLNGVVQLLGSKFGQDLSHKTAFIHQEILRHHHYPPPPMAPSPNDLFALQHPPQFLNFSHHQFPSQFALNFPAGGTLSPPPPPQSAPQLQKQPPPKIAASQGKVAKESGQTGTKRRGGAGGLNKVCGVSPQLEAVVGESALPRTEIVKQLWVYIRKNNLQDPSNRKMIICDEALRAVFETDSTDMFKMNKLLSKHIHSLQSPMESAAPKRLKTDREKSAENSETGSALVTISEPLAMFLGTGSKEMVQSEATQYILEYIKVNKLEDLESKVVMCDLKLRELFGCESIPTSDILDILARHHFKRR